MEKRKYPEILGKYIKDGIMIYICLCEYDEIYELRESEVEKKWAGLIKKEK